MMRICRYLQKQFSTPVAKLKRALHQQKAITDNDAFYVASHSSAATFVSSMVTPDEFVLAAQHKFQIQWWCISRIFAFTKELVFSG